MRTITIRTRIMLMLLLVGILSCAILGYLGSDYGQKIIAKEVNDQLSIVLSSKKDQIKTYLTSIENVVEVMGQNPTVIESAEAFSEAFYKLEEEQLNAECSSALGNYYTQFIDRLSQNMEIKKDQLLYYPKSLEGCYLQFEYIVNNPNPLGEKDKMNYAPDSSAYSSVHQKYHPFFRMLLKKYNFYDIFIVDLKKGDIVYSVFKETDFATNLYTGPYRSSNLADLARRLQTNSDLQKASWIDFAPYRPSYGAPAAFIGIPLTIEGQTVGGLIFQLPIGEINRIMTGGKQWETDGLGKTGETFLVGQDHLMRSVSRFFIQDSLGYRKTLLQKGEVEANIDRMYRYGSTVLQQKIHSNSLNEAFEGKSGVIEDSDYRGIEVIRHYEPLNFPGLDWAIVSKKDKEESFQPVTEFNKSIFIQTLVLILCITLLSLILANRFVKPVEKLTQAAKQLINGDTSQKVVIKSKDEFGVLGDTFNTMIGQLDEQKKAIQDQLQENQNLLENFVPPDFINRIKKGERTFADEYQNVSFITVDIVGFGALTNQVGAKKSATILNDLVDAFDEAAARNYVEKLRTVGDTYFAACGLFEPRLDHAKRIVQFALEIKQLLAQINLNRKLDLQMKTSVHTGNVMAGIVGTDKFSFDVWGETINYLFTMNHKTQDISLVLSEEVTERLSDLYTFTPVGEGTMSGKRIFTIKTV
ncbi:HAMP domain-containing protein [Aquimarina sp. ERC-38]|uniref:adenylate/guanylate cyclase domain-containing protein n=1 Tax=Aquimarina sp. ERC-38 TaxID=2949996 RepID=UPI00224725BC|nr:adenylate/guanylate cyclase domain-containing protein [Aquimarina sp. ERC-38]UZO79840.1 HAMP domain-containing protein [Aquimarina sp. ERC-38]